VKRSWYILTVVVAAMFLAQAAAAQWWAGEPVKETTDQQVYQMVMKYINDQTVKEKFFRINDPLAGRQRKLEFQILNNKIDRSGGFYVATAVFRDLDTGQWLLLGFYVEDEEEGLKMSKVKILEDDGKRRK